MFDHIVGRLYFKSKKVKTYGAFVEESIAKEYADYKQSDIAPNSVLFITSPEYGPIFLSEDDSQWKSFEKAIVYDCSDDVERHLSDYLWLDEAQTLIQVK